LKKWYVEISSSVPATDAENVAAAIPSLVVEDSHRGSSAEPGDYAVAQHPIRTGCGKAIEARPREDAASGEKAVKRRRALDSA